MGRPHEIIIDTDTASFDGRSSCSSITHLFHESFNSELSFSIFELDERTRWEEDKAASEGGLPYIPIRQESLTNFALPKVIDDDNREDGDKHNSNSTTSKDFQPKLPRRQTSSCDVLIIPRIPRRNVSNLKADWEGVPPRHEQPSYHVPRVPYKQMRRTKSLLSRSDHSSRDGISCQH